jgi:hypothetical protein
MKKGLSKFLVLVVSLMLVLGTLSCSAAVITDGSNFYVVGDANNDGEFDARDLVRLKKISVGLINEMAIAADFNGDGVIDATDIASARTLLLGNDKSDWSVIYK